MQKTRVWIWIGMIVVIVALASAAFFVTRSMLSKPTASNDKNPDDSPAVQSPTREDVPAGTVVPDVASANLPSGVAKPEEVKLSGGSSSPYLRNFHVVVKGDAISPANIISYAGDILTITFESVDKAYDFVQPDFGLRWQVPAGGSKTFQFQTANTGKFIFYCPSCGGPKSGPVGYITAASR